MKHQNCRINYHRKKNRKKNRINIYSKKKKKPKILIYCTFYSTRKKSIRSDLLPTSFLGIQQGIKRKKFFFSLIWKSNQVKGFKKTENLFFLQNHVPKRSLKKKSIFMSVIAWPSICDDDLWPWIPNEW